MGDTISLCPVVHRVYGSYGLLASLYYLYLLRVCVLSHPSGVVLARVGEIPESISSTTGEYFTVIEYDFIRFFALTHLVPCKGTSNLGPRWDSNRPRYYVRKNRGLWMI